MTLVLRRRNQRGRRQRSCNLERMATHSSILAWKILWTVEPGGQSMATHSSILAWKIPWTEEPGGLRSMGSQRVGLDLATKQQHEVQGWWH